MENNFYTDDLERLLKERSDEFRMYPSKRVWHSIYNDLHPGRRWPSIAMSMLLIIALLFMGYFNNNSGPSSTELTAKYGFDKNNVGKSKEGNYLATVVAKDESSIRSTAKHDQNDVANNSVVNIEGSNSGLQNASPPTTNSSLSNTPSTLSFEKSNSSISNIAATNTYNTITSITNDGVQTNNAPSRRTTARSRTTTPGNTRISVTAATTSIEKNTPTTEDIAANKKANGTVNIPRVDVEEEDVTNSTTKNTLPASIVKNTDPSNITPPSADDNDPEINKDKKDIQAATATNKTQPATPENDKAWIDNYAFYNKSSRKKWKDRMAMEMYITPSLGYRSLSGNDTYDPSSSFIANPNPVNTDVSNTVKHRPGISLEAGFGMVYSATKKIRLKGGLQVNLTNYNIHADKTSHPALTTLLLNDLNTGNAYISSEMSTLANSSTYQPIVLHNKTYQLSIPIGMSMKLYGTHKLEWYAGASIQPSFVFGGKSYLISSDRKNYVDGSRFMRKWNVSTGIETYLSYNMGNYNLQVGPQFRYQLYSTYNKQYTNTEKLYNVGVKIGILKNF